jgi:RES domain-containing protein
MRLTAWRLVKTRYAATAFDGEGARQYGGRWNSPGTVVAYAATTASLAILEVLVHLESGAILPSYSLVSVEFEEALVHTLIGSALPADWAASPPSAETQAVGDRWVRERQSAILRVPSAIVASEYNYLLNVTHPDFVHVRIATPTPFLFDSRLSHRSLMK